MKQEPTWRRYARLLGANPRADTEAELSFHYEMRVRDYVRRGMSEDAAREAARERLGDLDTVRRECGEQGDRYVREDRRREWFGEFRQDVKYGARVLLRSPGFALVRPVALRRRRRRAARQGVRSTTALTSVLDKLLARLTTRCTNDKQLFKRFIDNSVHVARLGRTCEVG